MEKNSAILILLCAGIFIFILSAWQESFLVAAIGCGIFGGSFAFFVLDFLTGMKPPKPKEAPEKFEEVVASENTYIPLKV